MVMDSDVWVQYINVTDTQTKSQLGSGGKNCGQRADGNTN